MWGVRYTEHVYYTGGCMTNSKRYDFMTGEETRENMLDF